jgi:large subunit ribosomal protein L19
MKYMTNDVEKSVIEGIRPGMTIRVHQLLTEKNAKGEEKKRTQIFEGIVLARKHGGSVGSTITVRKVTEGIGVEKIFPLHSPWISKIEIKSQAKVRRAKLGYLRSYGKKLKEKPVAK